MCCENKKFELLKECLLKYWDISGNILLYSALYNEYNTNNNYPFWVYLLTFIAIITSFARLMLKFRRLDIKSISFIMSPMLPCENYMCNTRVNGTYEPNQRNILLGGFLLFFLWIWYAFLIYPFITLIVMICVFYYNIERNELNQLILLYKNHNILSLFIEDIPIMIVLITIYTIDKKELGTLIWLCVLTIIKIITTSHRLFIKQKLFFTLDEFIENDILYLINENHEIDSSELELQIEHELQLNQQKNDFQIL